MKPRGRLELLLFVKLIELRSFKGTKSQFAKQMNTEESCSIQAKYNFLNKMLDVGVLKPITNPVNKVKWGEENLSVFSIDKERCWEFFKTTEEGRVLYKFMDEHTFMVD
tara:strand:- start:271 stop:597 length:327 start_codon:yes stop_codon:yes gene_type:complete